MAKSDTFEPKQKRSIEKKNHIIKTGLQLMMEQGYHHTTTDDIAAASGVSTGIIYRYFKDKHDILLAGLSFAFQKMYEEQYFELNIAPTEDIKEFIETLLEQFLAIHFENKSMHEELETMRHSDAEVAALYEEKEIDIVKKVASALREHGDCADDLLERTYTVFNLIEGYCHMCIRSTSSEIDLERMKQITVETVCGLLR